MFVIDLETQARMGEVKKADNAAHTLSCSRVMRSTAQQLSTDVTNVRKE